MEMVDGTINDRSAACPAGEELVSYLYDELAEENCSLIEAHLAGCDACTAEFAELSYARLDVYEWRRDEFAEMATPQIVVPYADKSRASAFDALRGWFAFPGRLAAAGGLAVLAIAAGVWLISPADQELVTTVTEPTRGPVNTRPIETPAINLGQDTDVASSAPVADERGARPAARRPSAPTPITTENKPLSVKAVQKTKPAKPGPVAVPRRNTSAPRLNDFEEEDDNTLRLGDLLAEIDTKE